MRNGEQAIRFGLLAVKNVGHGVVSAILEAREAGGPYRDMADVFRRVHARELNKKAVESLTKAGAFDRLAERNVILANLDSLLQLNRATQRQLAAGQAGLFRDEETQSLPSATLKPAPAASPEQRLRWEKELLGLYVSGHPLKDVVHLLHGRTTPIRELSADMIDYSVRVGGILTKIQRVVTRSKETMVFATLEDQTGSVEVLVFPRALQTNPNLWVEDRVVIVEGRVNDRDGTPKVICEDVQLVEPAGSSEAQRPTEELRVIPEELPRPCILLTVPRERTRDVLLALKPLLESLPKGPARVYLRIPTRNGTVDLVKTPYSVLTDSQTQAQFGQFLRPDAILVAIPETPVLQPVSRA